MIKLVVGADDLRHFAQIQKREQIEFKGALASPVRTRNMPRRAEDLLDGGSIYRVIKNRIVCRQRIIGFDQIQDPIKGTMSLIITDPEIIATFPTAKRPFQGWRYLESSAVPKDQGIFNIDDERPPAEMEKELAALGLL